MQVDDVQHPANYLRSVQATIDKTTFTKFLRELQQLQQIQSAHESAAGERQMLRCFLRILEWLQGHAKLIQGLQCFLPEGWHLDAAQGFVAGPTLTARLSDSKREEANPPSLSSAKAPVAEEEQPVDLTLITPIPTPDPHKEPSMIRAMDRPVAATVVPAALSSRPEPEQSHEPPTLTEALQFLQFMKDCCATRGRNYAYSQFKRMIRRWARGELMIRDLRSRMVQMFPLDLDVQRAFMRFLHPKQQRPVMPADAAMIVADSHGMMGPWDDNEMEGEDGMMDDYGDENVAGALNERDGGFNFDQLMQKQDWKAAAASSSSSRNNRSSTGGNKRQARRNTGGSWKDEVQASGQWEMGAHHREPLFLPSTQSAHASSSNGPDMSVFDVKDPGRIIDLPNFDLGTTMDDSQPIFIEPRDPSTTDAAHPFDTSSAADMQQQQQDIESIARWMAFQAFSRSAYLDQSQSSAPLLNAAALNSDGFEAIDTHVCDYDELRS